MMTILLLIAAWALAEALILLWWHELIAVNREMDRMMEGVQNASAKKI